MTLIPTLWNKEDLEAINKENELLISTNESKISRLRLSYPCKYCKKEMLISQDLATWFHVYYHTICLISQEKQQATKELLEKIYEIVENLYGCDSKCEHSLCIDYYELKQQLSKLGEGK